MDNLQNIKLDLSYSPPSDIFKNPHLQTIFARLFRPATKIQYQREKVDIKNGDFIDIDWSRVGSKSLAIICPGFESDSSRRYIVGSVNLLNKNNIDAVVINHRGCSGSPSKNYMFAVGDEEDLLQVIDSILSKYDYSEIFLVGYSTGGNLVLKYIANKSESINSRIKKAFITSPTLHLLSTMERFNLPMNKIYLFGFLFVMFRRLWFSRSVFPRPIRLFDFFSISNPSQFYDKFCYPDTQVKFPEYLTEHSACGHLSKVKIPTMIITSQDDPFLDPRFYPYIQAMENPCINLKLTEYGGHGGFVDFKGRYYWSEREMIKWLSPGESFVG